MESFSLNTKSEMLKKIEDRKALLVCASAEDNACVAGILLRSLKLMVQVYQNKYKDEFPVELPDSVCYGESRKPCIARERLRNSEFPGNNWAENLNEKSKFLGIINNACKQCRTRKS